jgi:hypothetical protein
MRLVTPLGPVEIKLDAVEIPSTFAIASDLLPLFLECALESPAFILCDGEELAFYGVGLSENGEFEGLAVVTLAGQAVRLDGVQEPPEPVASGIIPRRMTATLAAVRSRDGGLVFKSLVLEERNPGCTAGQPMLVVCEAVLAFAMLVASAEELEAANGSSATGGDWIMFQANRSGCKPQLLLVVPGETEDSYQVVGAQSAFH